MDVNQIAQMIEWLDEERRRDKATIAMLQERLDQQQTFVDEMQQRIGGVESDQTVMRENVLPAERERDIMENVRKEVRQLLESTESRRLTAERESERRIELGREALQRSIKELTERLVRVERQSSDVSNLRTEHDRQTDTIAVLQQRVDDLLKQSEEPDRRLAFLEEQRRQDARRISETETEIPEIRKQLDAVRPKMSLIEDLSIRNERRIQEVQNTESERREQIQQFIDQQNLLLQQRDQQIDDLVKRFGEHDDQMQQNIERFEVWEQAYREMKRIVADFDRISDRLERRINEVAEMQRLSEERFRQEWNDWRDDDQKRWKQLTLSNDEVWRNHDKEFELFIRRMTELETLLPQVSESLNRLWNLERERAQLYRERYQALLLEYDTGSTLPAAQSTNGSITNGSTSVS